jgi:hypothetical protein
MLPLFLYSTARQQLSVSYYDQEEIHSRIPEPPSFIPLESTENIEKGMMLLYEKKLFDFAWFLSCYGGVDIGNWKKGGDEIYTGSSFIAYRLWLFHLPLIHPYVEYSAMGPTFISKGDFAGVHFPSRFIFQNYVSLGIEFGEGIGMNLDVRFLRYAEGDIRKIGEAFRIPTLISLGFLF